MAKNPISRTTPLDCAILGLVIQNPMTGYGIRMMFEKTALGSFSSSPGTIYPALKRLERMKLLEKKTPGPGAQELFTITKKGVVVLTDWVFQPVTRDEVIKNLNIVLLRFAFIDTLPSRKGKQRFLKSFRDAVQSYIPELEAFHDKESRHMPDSGRQAFEHGLEAYRTTLQWIEKILLTHIYK